MSMQAQEPQPRQQEPTYKQCIGCRYHVNETDRVCPNCGVPEPMSSISGMAGMFTLGPEMNDATRAMIGAFIGAVLGALLMQGVGVAVGVAVGDPGHAAAAGRLQPDGRGHPRCVRSGRQL